MHRFKIDITTHSALFQYALYRKRSRLFGRHYWEYIQCFETQAEARKYYEAIKDLPEYLA
jgi:hypothetical protein